MIVHPRRLLLALIALSLSVVIVACGDDDDDMNGMNMGSGSTTTPMTGGGMMGSPEANVDPDLAFIDSMIPHHESAIMMAEMARDEAEHDELKDLAANIIETQQAEIDQMKEWRDEWFGGAPPSGGMQGMSGMAGMNMSEADMQMLREAGDFDKAFIDAMTEHHQSAISMAEEILKTTERPEITQLANDIITAQQTEIDQMEEWRAEWFGQ